jgi:hypothetical protein
VPVAFSAILTNFFPKGSPMDGPMKTALFWIWCLRTFLFTWLKHLCSSWTVTTRLTKSKCRSAARNLRLWRVVSTARGSNWQTVRRLWMNLMLWTGVAFFRAEGLTNAYTYSTRRSRAALKYMCSCDILVVNKNCH